MRVDTIGSWEKHLHEARNVLAFVAKEPWNVIHHRHAAKLSREIAHHAPSQALGTSPVIFFNASTRLSGLSLNAAFSLLSSWSLHLTGGKVIHFVCRAGLRPCLLGTRPEVPEASPPCMGCIFQSRRLYAGAEVRWFRTSPTNDLLRKLQGLRVEELGQVEHQKLPLGTLVLPSVRWILRRHHLKDDPPTRALFRFYMASAWHVAHEFKKLVDEVNPSAIVVFNGMFYPEALVRYVARKMGIRVISHEVGVQPLSAFFTEGEATAYPLEIQEDFDLTPEQNRKLDHYLADRFKGNFTMAGIRFWPKMVSLNKNVLERLLHFKRMVLVFTNVVFDTSQLHANVVFSNMFEWLDLIVEMSKEYSETLFVIRAHPDEYRPGKRSCETVAEWVANRLVQRRPNLVFIDADEPASSYELIERAHFVMVYNSTIGLEASILGKAVVCGGKARFTPYRTVYFPKSREAFREQTCQFLTSDRIDVPVYFRVNARRFMYYHLFCASLPFEDFLKEDRAKPGYVRLKDITWEKLNASHSPVLQAILQGVTQGKPFVIGG